MIRYERILKSGSTKSALPSFASVPSEVSGLCVRGFMDVGI